MSESESESESERERVGGREGGREGRREGVSSNLLLFLFFLSIITTYLHKPDPAASIWTAYLLLRYFFMHVC